MNFTSLEVTANAVLVCWDDGRKERMSMERYAEHIDDGVEDLADVGDDVVVDYEAPSFVEEEMEEEWEDTSDKYDDGFLSEDD